MKHCYVVIMAGGGGTRLWPMSRQAKPKQFLPLTSERTLLQEMYDNVRLILPDEQIFVMADEPRAVFAREQLPTLPAENMLIEPSGRDNGPAIGLATWLLWRRDNDSRLAIVWSDHSVEYPERFASCLKTAFTALDGHPNQLITVGIKPTRPATELGYIRMGQDASAGLPDPLYSVDKFAEKPDAHTAEEYVTDWRYLWNTGYKIYRAEHMLNLFRQHQPSFAGILEQIDKRITATPGAAIDDLWEQLEKRDIERLITEKTRDIMVIPADLGWSDVGSWDTLHDLLSAQSGEDLVARAEHVDVGSRRCLIISDKRVVATAGLDNVVIIDTPDALLVIDKDRAQDVKKLVEQLKERNLPIL